MVVMVSVCTALVEPQWFMVYGGGCRDAGAKSISFIGVIEFFRQGEFQKVTHKDRATYANTKYVYKFGQSDEQGEICIS